jgi:DNA-binding transcriptional MerR regulator
MLKIGDFAKLSRVSIRMLRYYDELGLLVPEQVDPVSGYRFYAAQQLPRLNRILALQDLGFSLEQVGQLLHEDVSLEQLRGMLRLKQAELQGRVLAEQERLGRVAARLVQIEREGQTPAYDVVLKETPPQLVAGVRGFIGGYPAIGELFGELIRYLIGYRAVGLMGAIWHDDVSDERRFDAEALVFLRAPLPPTQRVQVYELPAATMASVVHHGPLLELGVAYESLVRWLEAQGYTISGANRELYVHYALPSRQDDASYVTEIQFPVVRH